MLFKDIVGQDEVKQSLIASVEQNKVAHAQLFAGPEGTGKLALAIAYAQYINCLAPTPEDSCGSCSSCLKYSKLIHPDLHFVFPIVKKKKEKKETCDDYLPQWREFNEKHPYSNINMWLDYIDSENSQAVIYTAEGDEIIKKLSLKVYEGKYKTMIIWCPERMNQECANKILKVLEEPYGNTLFILVSDNSEIIIGTILSRTQRISIKAITANAIESKLTTDFQLNATDAKAVAHIARGSYIKALDTVQMQEESQANLKLFVEMMRSSYTGKIKEIKIISEKLANLSKEKQKDYLDYAQSMFREYFMNNFRIEELVYLKPNEADFGVKFSPFINENNIVGFMEEFALADRHVAQNVNSKMVFFDLCLKTTMLLKKK